MPTLFTRIIEGELPGHFVWKDAQCVAFLTIAPLKPGHVLVVPRAEVDHWLDLDPKLTAHLTGVAQVIGQAVQAAFQPTKVGLVIAGLEVPHVHLHVTPIEELRDLDFANADANAEADDIAAAAQAIRVQLRAAGRAEVSD